MTAIAQWTMKPGIYTADQLSNAAYHSGPGISCTGLKKIAVSPAHFKYGEFKQTAAMAIGSATHSAILEPESFAKQYVTLQEGKDRRSAEYKALCAAHGTDSVLVSADASQINAMQSAVRTNPVANKWLYQEQGRNELSVYAKDPETGILVRCRFDRLLDRGFSPDLKTTTDASPRGFSSAIAKYGYAFQAAFYMDTYYWATGDVLEGFGFIAVESKAPHNVMCYRLDDESIAVGREQYRSALNIYANCLESGVWDGYDGASEEQLIGLPFWALEKNDEVEIDFGDEE
jgi:exodeoxyribonuclease VIII